MEVIFPQRGKIIPGIEKVSRRCLPTGGLRRVPFLERKGTEKSFHTALCSGGCYSLSHGNGGACGRNIPLAWNVPQNRLNELSCCQVPGNIAHKNSFRKTTFCGPTAPPSRRKSPTAHQFRVALKLFSLPFLSRKGSRRRPPVCRRQRYRFVTFVAISLNASSLVLSDWVKSGDNDPSGPCSA